MRKIKKKYKKPRRPWDRERIDDEKKLLRKYGLRRKRDVWRAEEILRNFRRRARDLIAVHDEQEEKKLLEKLKSFGIFEKKATLTDVLSLDIDDILKRRLQTLVHERKISNTLLHSRQLITHGHISIEGRRNKYPSFLVPKKLENKIALYKEGD